MSSLWHRAGALVLLVGFVVQAGDGVAATLCHSGMDHGTEASHTHHGPADAEPVGHEDSSHPVPDSPHESESPTDDEPCPFGSGAWMVCAGAGTAVAPMGLVRVPVFPLLSVTTPASVDASGVLLAHETFRPPRA